MQFVKPFFSLFFSRSLNDDDVNLNNSTRRLCSFCLHWTILVGKKKKETCIFFSSDRKRRWLIMFVGYIKQTFEQYLWGKGATRTKHKYWWEQKTRRRRAHGDDVYLSGEGVVIWSNSWCYFYFSFCSRFYWCASYPDLELINSIVYLSLCQLIYHISFFRWYVNNSKPT